MKLREIPQLHLTQKQFEELDKERKKFPQIWKWVKILELRIIFLENRLDCSLLDDEKAEDYIKVDKKDLESDGLPLIKK